MFEAEKLTGWATAAGKNQLSVSVVAETTRKPHDRYGSARC